AEEDVRFLHERSVLVEEKFVFDELARSTVGQGAELTLQMLAALGGIDQDVSAAKSRSIRREITDANGARRKKAVTVGGASRGQPGESHGDLPFPEEREEPAHRSSECGVAVRPSHRFAERDLRAHSFERAGKELGGGCATLESLRRDVSALRCFLHEEGIH